MINYWKTVKINVFLIPSNYVGIKRCKFRVKHTRQWGEWANFQPLFDEKRWKRQWVPHQHSTLTKPPLNILFTRLLDRVFPSFHNLLASVLLHLQRGIMLAVLFNILGCFLCHERLWWSHEVIVTTINLIKIWLVSYVGPRGGLTK